MGADLHPLRRRRLQSRRSPPGRGPPHRRAQVPDPADGRHAQSASCGSGRWPPGRSCVSWTAAPQARRPSAPTASSWPAPRPTASCGVWDAASGKVVLRLRQGEVSSLAFSPDGKHLAVARTKASCPCGTPPPARSCSPSAGPSWTGSSASPSRRTGSTSVSAGCPAGTPQGLELLPPQHDGEVKAWDSWRRPARTYSPSRHTLGASAAWPCPPTAREWPPTALRLGPAGQGLVPGPASGAG